MVSTTVCARLDAPLSLATYNMVWNITRDKITERMAVSPDEAWAVPGSAPSPQPAAGTVPDPMTDLIGAGRWEPANKAQGDLVKTFKQEHSMK